MKDTKFKRSDLVKSIAVKCDLTDAVAEAVVSTMIDTLSTKLEQGYEIVLMNFCTIKLLDKPSSIVKGLGKKFRKPAHRKIKFMPASSLTERVNKNATLKIKESTPLDTLAERIKKKP